MSDKWIKRQSLKCRLAILLAALLLVSGCGGEGDSMTLKKVSSADEFIRKLPDTLIKNTEGIDVFEFTLDESVPGYSVDAWYVEDGEWVSSGGIADDIDRIGPGKVQIGVQLTETGFSLFGIDEYGANRYDLDLPAGLDTCPDTNTTKWMLWEEGITPGFEQQLIVKAGWKDNQDAKNMDDFCDFREVDCDAGVALTITFTAAETDETA